MGELGFGAGVVDKFLGFRPPSWLVTGIAPWARLAARVGKFISGEGHYFFFVLIGIRRGVGAYGDLGDSAYDASFLLAVATLPLIFFFDIRPLL